MVHAAGIDRVVDQAVEEAIVRALRSPAVMRAIERAIESGVSSGRSSEEIAQLVKRILASDVADQAWAEILASDQAQQLVERVAGAPEIRAAIASQGAGLLTDIGVRLTVITEHFDDALERIVRRRDADSETDQAGLATRSVAAAVDLGLLFAGYALIASVVSSLFTAASGKHPSLAWAGRRLDADRRHRRCDLCWFLVAGRSNAWDAIPVDPPDLLRFASHHVWSRAPACVRSDPELCAARPRILRDSARPISPCVARPPDEDRSRL
jgi:hypothetical protein